MKQYLNYIDGQFVSSEHRFNDYCPLNGRVVAQVHEADEAMVSRAILAGQRAVAAGWGVMPVAERAAMLYRIADEIDRRFDDFLAAEMEDTGKPRSMAAVVDIPRGAANFRIFADLLKTASLDCYMMDQASGAKALNYALRKPLGVVGVISPWNLPLLLLTWKLAPALACGNAVVAKPSEETPGTASLLAEVMHSVGVPAGVFNLVHGFGPGSAGEFIATSAKINAITFTGESRTGSSIMKAAAVGVKPVSFELGGKNAAIVFADCHFEKTLDGLMRTVFLNSGQVCLCAERVLVERPIFDAFVAGFKKRIQSLNLQDSFGPMVSSEHRDKVLSYFAMARDEGATFVAGGGVPAFGDARDAGYWVEPTVITGLPDSARCMREEVFGPFCHVAPFDTEAEAIARANDTEYGLSATVWTGNVNRAHRVSAQMRVGVVWVNTWFLRDLRTPFGGAGLSGIGREGGMHSLNFYSELTNVCVHIETGADA